MKKTNVALLFPCVDFYSFIVACMVSYALQFKLMSGCILFYITLRKIALLGIC